MAFVGDNIPYTLRIDSFGELRHLHRTLSFAVIALAASVLACGSSNSSTSTTPSTPTTVTSPTALETFSGVLNPKGSSAYTYTQVLTGPIYVTLSSLMTGPLGPAVATQMGLGTGTPTDTDCAVASSLVLTPSLNAQIATPTVSPGSYCVRVFDTGSMTVPLYFAVRIAHS